MLTVMPSFKWLLAYFLAGRGRGGEGEGEEERRRAANEARKLLAITEYPPGETAGYACQCDIYI